MAILAGPRAAAHSPPPRRRALAAP
jgi:hypothetical protein